MSNKKKIEDLRKEIDHLEGAMYRFGSGGFDSSTPKDQGARPKQVIRHSRLESTDSPLSSKNKSIKTHLSSPNIPELYKNVKSHADFQEGDIFASRQNDEYMTDINHEKEEKIMTDRKSKYKRTDETETNGVKIKPSKTLDGLFVPF